MWAGGTAETQEPEAQEGRERPRPRAPRAPRPQRGRGGCTATGLPQRCCAGACAGAGGAPRGWGAAGRVGREGPAPPRPSPASARGRPHCPFLPAVPFRLHRFEWQPQLPPPPALAATREGVQPSLLTPGAGCWGGQGPFSGLSASGHLSPPWHVAHWTASAISGLALVSPEAGNVMPAPQAPAGRPRPRSAPPSSLLRAHELTGFPRRFQGPQHHHPPPKPPPGGFGESVPLKGMKQRGLPTPGSGGTQQTSWPPRLSLPGHEAWL